MNWRWVSLAAALAAIVIGYGAFVDSGSMPTANHEMPEQPGYYLKDAVILRTREDGSPGVELIARRIQQRLTQPARGEAITMESVRVNYFGKKDWQWALTADKGEVPPNSRIVQLDGNVELRPLEGDSNAFLRTDELAIDTEKNLAYSTRSPAHMRFGQHVMTVKSLRADLTSEKLRLETVNGRFEPQRKQ
ncbi:LPS export ABC transporter periplasmic protein LptC [Steroidobacter sp.]|uniref:LPS export ABC transporter periplasmic protein LptC n=1 Tax=Steroidobacter sp. TaxID=1978227 RepID=UPI001A3ED614|nr:LPS export ABC transporter periplasmic protein LptC [Steroidobacter sp.]MBL8268625.1 LPS export ABC transporter periplasmic protein LptC [Steroidobacter sp.]